MIRLLKFCRSIRRNEEGATLLEFAFVAPVFMLLLIGAMDVGYAMYIRAIAAGTLEQAARSGSLDGATESQLQSQIRLSMFNILPASARNNSNVAITTKNYSDYSRIDAAEKIVTDADSDGVLDVGDCWLDEDLNNQYGVNEGANGIGGADDGVYYTVAITMDSFFPLYQFLNRSKSRTITVKTLVINQPYAAQSTRPTVCRTV